MAVKRKAQIHIFLYDLLNDLERRLDYAKEHTTFPEIPDLARVEAFQMEVNERVCGMRFDIPSGARHILIKARVVRCGGNPPTAFRRTACGSCGSCVLPLCLAIRLRKGLPRLSMKTATYWSMWRRSGSMWSCASCWWATRRGIFCAGTPMCCVSSGRNWSRWSP